MNRLSAIVPTFNCAAYLEEAIASALGQDGVELEVVVVDDGSTDETPRILASFDGRIRVVRQPNRGLPAARNVGIAHATGELIAFLDADDTWEPGKSKTQLEYLRTHPDCGLVSCDAYRIDENGRRMGTMLGQAARTLPEGRCLERLFLGNFILVPGTIVRRSVLASVGGFDESLPSVEDYDLWLRIAAVAAIGVVPDPLASYRIRAGQMSKNRDRMLAAELRVLESALGRTPELAERAGRKVRRRFARLYDESGWWDLQEGLREKARSKFLRAARQDPFWAKPWLHVLESGLPAIGPWRRSQS